MSSVQSEDYEEVIRESSEEEDEMDSQPFFGSEDPSEEEDQDDDVDDLGMRVGTALAVRNDAPENLQLVTYSAEYENLLRNAEKIARNRIAANTRAQYNKANCNFIYWVYYYQQGVLKPEFIELFKDAREKGQDVYLKQVIEDVIVKEEKCPLNLAMFKANSFFSYILTYKAKDGNFFSYSCYDGKRSALMHMLNFSSDFWDFKEREKLSQLMTSLKKTIMQEKKELGLRTTEGKEAMSFATYELACELLIEEGSAESIFTLLWLTLQWNLIARSEAVEMISFNQMKWDSDHLKIYIAKHKSDPLGENKDEPRHVYTNPVRPTVCPIRAMSSYLFLFPNIASDGQKLFPGSKQRGRFNRLFHDLLVKNKDVFLSHGVDPSLLGTHSIRKGAATYCCAGVVPGPPVVSVCLRAGWTLGRVKERYLKYELAGDEVVGRTLTGIPPQSPEFGISPAHFTEHTNRIFLQDCLNFIFPKQGTNTPLFKQLIASYIYHESFTTEKTRNTSPLHSCSYYQFACNEVDRSKYVTTSYPWQSVPGCPNLTGIPFHCQLQHKLLEIHDMQKKMPAEIVQKFIEEMNLRNLGCTESVIGQTLMKKMDDLSDRIDTKLNKLDEEKPIFDESRVFELTTNAVDATTTNSSAKTTGAMIMFPTLGV